MVTNEDIVMCYPDQFIQMAETSSRVDSFTGIFDGTDAWLLKTPFNPLISNMAVGLIVQIIELTAVNPKSGLYFVKSLQADGFQLKLGGYDVSVGRGPGVTFGTTAVQVSVFDLSSFIKAAQLTVDTHMKNSVSVIDEILSERIKDVVKMLKLIRMGTGSSFLTSTLGLNNGSLMELEQRLLSDLKSEVLMAITRKSLNTKRWTRIVR